MENPTSAVVAAERPEPPAAPVSFESFLAWLDEDTWAEWVDGAIIVNLPAGLTHQLIRDFLFRILIGFVETRRLGWVVSAPFLMRLPTRAAGPRPAPSLRPGGARRPPQGDLRRRTRRPGGRDRLPRQRRARSRREVPGVRDRRRARVLADRLPPPGSALLSA